jgi:hypothetical protein
MKRLAGVGHLHVAGGVAQARVDGLLEQAGVDLSAGGIRFRVEPVTRQPERGPIGPRHLVRVTFPRENRTDEQWAQLRRLASTCRIRPLTRNGAHLHAEAGQDETPDSLTRVLRVAADAGRDPWFEGDPAALVIDMPTHAVEVDVPFVFEDIPLSDGPQ